MVLWTFLPLQLRRRRRRRRRRLLLLLLLHSLPALILRCMLASVHLLYPQQSLRLDTHGSRAFQCRRRRQHVCLRLRLDQHLLMVLLLLLLRCGSSWPYLRVWQRHYADRLR